MSTPRRPRLAVVISHPIQYYAPWFRWLARTAGFDLRVFYLWDFGVVERTDPRFQVSFRWDVDLLSGYEHEFVPNRARDPGAESFWGFDNPRITRALAAWRPSAILLFGYKWATHLRVIAWARLHRVPLIFRGDSHLLGRARPAWSRRWPMAAVYRQMAGVLYAGQANRAYFAALGVPARKLFFAPHAVDAARFERTPEIAAAAAAFRAGLGIAPGQPVLLFAGKLVPAKQPAELVSAFLASAPPSAVLVVVGDGPDKARVAAAAAGAAPGRVHLLPFANQSEMPVRYAAADVFALPSKGVYETWGLAVNEAMHLGVPCLVSDRVGCQADLVIPGETGWVFAAEDPVSLRSAVAEALAAVADPARRAALRGALARRIAGYTYLQASAGLERAVAALVP